MGGHVLARLSLGDRGLDRGGGDGGWGHVGQIRQSHGEEELRGRCESRGREGTVRRVSRVARGGGTRAGRARGFQVVWLPLRRSTSEDLRITHLIVRQDAERLALLRCCATGKEIDVRFGAIVGPRSRAIRRARARPSPLARLASNALVLSIVFLSLLGRDAPRPSAPGAVTIAPAGITARLGSFPRAIRQFGSGATSAEVARVRRRSRAPMGPRASIRANSSSTQKTEVGPRAPHLELQLEYLNAIGSRTKKRSHMVSHGADHRDARSVSEIRRFLKIRRVGRPADC